MFMTIPNYEVEFAPIERIHTTVVYHVSENDLEAFCRVLRRNNITAYQVRLHRFPASTTSDGPQTVATENPV